MTDTQKKLIEKFRASVYRQASVYLQEETVVETKIFDTSARDVTPKRMPNQQHRQQKCFP